MEFLINNKLAMPQFRFEDTKHKLGIRIWGDKESFHELYEVLTDCYDCEDDYMSQARACSYIGVISYFSYEVRHTFMGDRLVKFGNKQVKEWTDEVHWLFEAEPIRFEVGMELSWPYMLCILAAWWECVKQKDCSTHVMNVIRKFSGNVDMQLMSRSKGQYRYIEPYILGAIYTYNPYLMLTMMHIQEEYLRWKRIMGRVSIKELAGYMECASYGTCRYNDFMATLKLEAKKLHCQIEELSIDVGDEYEI